MELRFYNKELGGLLSAGSWDETPSPRDDVFLEETGRVHTVVRVLRTPKYVGVYVDEGYGPDDTLCWPSDFEDRTIVEVLDVLHNGGGLIAIVTVRSGDPGMGMVLGKGNQRWEITGCGTTTPAFALRGGANLVLKHEDDLAPKAGTYLLEIDED